MLEAPVLLDGMLSKERLLDIVENFVIFDDSKPGGTRKSSRAIINSRESTTL